jgi:hypothetical protein
VTVGRAPKHNPEAGAQGSTRQKDEILKTIAKQMAAGTWRPYHGVRALALQYDMPLASAQQYVADASRLVRLSWGGEEAKAAIIERIQQIGTGAEFRTEEVALQDGTVVQVRKPDYRSALRAAETLAAITGLTGATADVVIKFQQMSDHELWLEAERYGKQLNLQGKRVHVTTTGESIEPSRDPDPDAAPGASTAEADALDRVIAGSTRGR